VASTESDRLLRAVGRRLAELRTASGTTQEEFAEELAVSVNYVRLVERGGQNLTLTTMARFARALGTTVADLLVPPRTLRATPGRPRRASTRR
jgi:transcriptional regulator with XRE-family HTH domain